MEIDSSQRGREGNKEPSPGSPQVRTAEESRPAAHAATIAQQDGDDIAPAVGTLDRAHEVPPGAQDEASPLVPEPGDGAGYPPGARVAETPDTRGRNVELDLDEAYELLTGPGPTAVVSVASGAGTGPLGAREQAARRSPLFPSLYFDDRLGRILLSIVLAALMWFYVVNLENPTINTQFADLAVDVRGTAPTLKVMNSLPAVDASIQAPQNVVSTLGKADIQPYVDLTGLPEGVHQVPVHAEILSSRARDVGITFDPSRIEVQLEVQVTRVFSVEVERIGTPAFGYGLAESQVNPEQVTVRGPRDAVARVEHVIAQVDVDGKAGTQQGLKTPVALDASGQEVKGLAFEPATVQVVVPINLLLNYKIVPVRVPLEGQPAPGYQVASITIDPTNVTVCCSPGLLEPLQVLNTQPVAITGTTSTLITTAELILPSGVELYPGQPRQISVTVSIESPETTLPVSVAPVVEGLNGGMSAVVSPNRLELLLAGTFAQLQSLSPADIRATVDVRGRAPGTYELTPDISVPQGVKVQSSTPALVTVTLIAPTPVPTQTPVPVPTATRTVQPAQSPSPVATVTPQITSTQVPTELTHTPAGLPETTPAAP
jgi:YbbR domain-containing protein